MGADLYIDSIHNVGYEQYRHKFEEACERRNALTFGTPECDAVQREVTDYYNKMFDPEGYFRDSYNDSSLFWVLDLSWWNDVTPLLDENARLPLEEARKLRSEVAQRSEIMERKIAQHEAPFNGPEDDNGEQGEWARSEAIPYFREKLARFIQFLDRSLELGECIHCSI